MKRTLAILSIIILAVLPVMAQGWTMQRNDRYISATQVSAPTASFQSTSAMVGSGSAYSANPTLNADGTASYQSSYSPVSTPSGPNRGKKAGGVEPTDDDEELPLGDGLFLLALLALGYAARKRTSILES